MTRHEIFNQKVSLAKNRKQQSITIGVIEAEKLIEEYTALKLDIDNSSKTDNKPQPNKEKNNVKEFDGGSF